MNKKLILILSFLSSYTMTEPESELSQPITEQPQRTFGQKFEEYRRSTVEGMRNIKDTLIKPITTFRWNQPEAKNAQIPDVVPSQEPEVEVHAAPDASMSWNTTGIPNDEWTNITTQDQQTLKKEEQNNLKNNLKMDLEKTSKSWVLTDYRVKNKIKDIIKNETITFDDKVDLIKPYFKNLNLADKAEVLTTLAQSKLGQTIGDTVQNRANIDQTLQDLGALLSPAEIPFFIRPLNETSNATEKKTFNIKIGNLDSFTLKDHTNETEQEAYKRFLKEQNITPNNVYADKADYDAFIDKYFKYKNSADTTLSKKWSDNLQNRINRFPNSIKPSYAEYYNKENILKSLPSDKISFVYAPESSQPRIIVTTIPKDIMIETGSTLSDMQLLEIAEKFKKEANLTIPVEQIVTVLITKFNLKTMSYQDQMQTIMDNATLTTTEKIHEIQQRFGRSTTADIFTAMAKKTYNKELSFDENIKNFQQKFNQFIAPGDFLFEETNPTAKTFNFKIANFSKFTYNDKQTPQANAQTLIKNQDLGDAKDKKFVDFIAGRLETYKNWISSGNKGTSPFDITADSSSSTFSFASSSDPDASLTNFNFPNDNNAQPFFKGESDDSRASTPNMSDEEPSDNENSPTNAFSIKPSSEDDPLTKYQLSNAVTSGNAEAVEQVLKSGNTAQIEDLKKYTESDTNASLTNFNFPNDNNAQPFFKGESDDSRDSTPNMSDEEPSDNENSPTNAFSIKPSSEDDPLTKYQLSNAVTSGNAEAVEQVLKSGNTAQIEDLKKYTENQLTIATISNNQEDINKWSTIQKLLTDYAPSKS